MHFLKSISTYDLNPIESPTVMGRCLFGFLIFCFVAKIVFTCHLLFDWLPKEFRCKATDGWEDGFKNVPWAKWNPTCHPDVAVFEKPSKFLQLVFHCKTLQYLEVTTAYFIITKAKFWQLEISVEEINISYIQAQMYSK